MAAEDTKSSLERAEEVIKKIKAAVDKILEKRDEFVAKINVVVDKIESLSYYVNYSNKRIKREYNKLMKELDAKLAGFRAQLEKMIQQVQAGVDKFLAMISRAAGRNVASKLASLIAITTGTFVPIDPVSIAVPSVKLEIPEIPTPKILFNIEALTSKVSVGPLSVMQKLV